VCSDLVPGRLQGGKRTPGVASKKRTVAFRTPSRPKESAAHTTVPGQPTKGTGCADPWEKKSGRGPGKLRLPLQKPSASCRTAEPQRFRRPDQDTRGLKGKKGKKARKNSGSAVNLGREPVPVAATFTKGGKSAPSFLEKGHFPGEKKEPTVGS